MRVLLVTHYYPGHGGGIEIAAGELAHRLARRGVDIVWVASESAAVPLAEGITLMPMRTWNVAERRMGFAFPLWSPISLSQLWSVVAKCDLVHIHDALYLGSLFAYLSAWLLGKPVVVTQHVGQIPNHPGMSFSVRLTRWMLAFAYRSLGRVVLGGCAQCVFISPKVRDYFVRLFRFRQEPMYIPNGVDQQVFHSVSQNERLELRTGLGWPADKAVLLFVGRFIDRKGLPLLRSLAESFPECEWVFVGRGPHDPTRWGLANVHCPGQVGHPQLAAYYRAADLLVLPSVIEGFPLVVQEAMACGTPVLVTPEIVRGYSSVMEVAYTCEPRKDRLLSTITGLLSSPSVLQARREAVASFAQREWDWERCADRYLVLYNQCIDKPSVRAGIH